MALQGLTLELAAVIPSVVQAGLPNCLCTIQRRTNTVSVTGQPDLSAWVNIPEFENINAMAGIFRPTFPDLGGVTRAPQQFDSTNDIHVLLMGVYLGIKQEYQCVLVGGPYAGTYEIMTAEPDSQSGQTRLGVRVWTL